ncbi:DUF58 domain-containing protein [Paracoccus aminophilus]|uniref:DUF58 domain-containing protein n=1 Tax=Paracoccus aminophilus JCM 7686 TaxID=1367847 RepID=S5XLR7_PARAH|nr:DUF58 domain-containing protein [Paracoccus aminophilus]AGT08174.1 hypothetical protein JCM7686_1065 [Paracoccus aminophilus JCM 7686]
MSRSADQLRADAEVAAGGLPALLLAAERLSAALVSGSHGMRRAGIGEEFWQYRPAMAGDDARSIDWRRSARSDGQFIRDREAQIAQSAALWVARGQGMDFTGGPDRPTKRHRAEILALALTMALLRGGERVALLGEVPRPGRLQAERIAQSLLEPTPAAIGDDEDPPAALIRPGQQIVLISDFLGDPEPVIGFLTRAAAMGVKGALLQVLDPDEESFPFEGAVLFRSAAGGASHDTRDAKGLRAAYLDRLAERKSLLTRAATEAGWHFSSHDTLSPPSAALLWLSAVLEG